MPDITPQSPLMPNIDTPVYQPTEIIHTDDRVVACDGGASALGHPRVWLRIEERDKLCPYCSRLFVLNDGAGHGDH